MKTRINFNKSAKLYMACEMDLLRPAMECVYFQNGYAYATNSYILVKAKISDISSLPDEDIQKLDGKMLHWSVYKKILAYDDVKITDDGISVNKDNSEMIFKWSTIDSKFPDCDKVISYVESKNVNVDFEKIGINPRMLYLLSESIGLRSPTAIIKDAATAILIKYEGWDVIGLCMPVMI